MLNDYRAQIIDLKNILPYGRRLGLTLPLHTWGLWEAYWKLIFIKIRTWGPLAPSNCQIILVMNSYCNPQLHNCKWHGIRSSSQLLIRYELNAVFCTLCPSLSMHVCVCVYALLCSYSSLLYSQTNSKLYLIMDFVNGGHLFFHLYRQGIFRYLAFKPLNH